VLAKILFIAAPFRAEVKKPPVPTLRPVPPSLPELYGGEPKDKMKGNERTHPRVFRAQEGQMAKPRRKGKPRNRRASSQRRRVRASPDTATVPEGFSTPVLHTFKFDDPFAGIPEDARRNVLREVGTNAAERLLRTKDTLYELARKVEPCEFLATASCYCLHKPLDAAADITQDGPYSQAVVEALQSIFLSICADELGGNPTSHRVLFDLLDGAQSSIDDLNKRDWQTLADERDFANYVFVQSAREHTRRIRNWGHPQHMKLILTELFDPLEGDISTTVGLTVRELLSMFDSISNACSERRNNILDVFRPMLSQRTLTEMARAWCTHLGKPREYAKRLIMLIKSRHGSINELRQMVIAYMHQFFADIYRFTGEELNGMLPSRVAPHFLQSLIGRLSIRFGGLAEKPFEHLLTQSPIRSRPFIELGANEYFVPIPGLLNSFSLEIVETLICENLPLWHRYLNRRSKYLEFATQRQFREAFPDAFVEPNVKWSEPSSEKVFETDVVVVLGPLAFVIEAKSHRVSDSARRGGTGSLRRDFDELVDSASVQTARLADLLEKRDTDLIVHCSDGREVPIHCEQIRRAICVSVTLDYLPVVTLCWKMLVKAGLARISHQPKGFGGMLAGLGFREQAGVAVEG
jgi:hypothetical protein